MVIQYKSTSTHRVVENVHIGSVTGREKSKGTRKKKQVDARKYDQIDKTQTPKEKRKKKGKEKQPAARLKVCTEREEEREIKKIDITHPHQGPP